MHISCDSLSLHDILQTEAFTMMEISLILSLAVLILINIMDSVMGSITGL